MQALEKDPGIQLLQMHAHVMGVLSTFPCGDALRPSWSPEQRVMHEVRL